MFGLNACYQFFIKAGMLCLCWHLCGWEIPLWPLTPNWLPHLSFAGGTTSTNPIMEFMPGEHFRPICSHVSPYNVFHLNQSWTISQAAVDVKALLGVCQIGALIQPMDPLFSVTNGTDHGREEQWSWPPLELIAFSWPHFTNEPDTAEPWH